MILSFPLICVTVAYDKTVVNTCLEDDMKKYAQEIFIDGLSGMATGLFATLIIGTIIVQIGGLIPAGLGTAIV